MLVGLGGQDLGVGGDKVGLDPGGPRGLDAEVAQDGLGRVHERGGGARRDRRRAGGRCGRGAGGGRRSGGWRDGGGGGRAARQPDGERQRSGVDGAEHGSGRRELGAGRAKPTSARPQKAVSWPASRDSGILLPIAVVPRLLSPTAMRSAPLVVLLALAASAAGCGSTASLPVSAGVGPAPELPAPNRSLFPTVNVADAVGWRSGQAPTAASGLAVSAFAEGLDHPRWLAVLPNGDVLVAESGAPPEAGTNGLRGRIKKYFAKKAGAAVPSADRVTLLRDTDGDGRADVRTVFLDGLASPFGMALAGGHLYVGNSGSLVRVPYRDGDTRITATPETVAELPAGTYNQHWTRNVIASADGRTLYVAVGSASNVGEHGLDEEVGRAAIWAVNVATGAHRLWADGLRNPVGMAWEPETGALWTVVNERDELGSDLVPRLPHVGPGGRVLRLAPTATSATASTRASSPQRPDPGGHGARARLRARAAHGVAGTGVVRRLGAGGLRRRHVRRPTRVVESPAPRAATRWSSCPSPAAGRTGTRATC